MGFFFRFPPTSLRERKGREREREKEERERKGRERVREIGE